MSLNYHKQLKFEPLPETECHLHKLSLQIFCMLIPKLFVLHAVIIIFFSLRAHAAFPLFIQ